MNRQDDHFRYLFEQFISKKASREELNELFELLKQPGMEETSREILDIYFAGPVSGKELDRNYWAGRLQEIINTAQGAPVEPDKVPRHSILRTGYWWAAAAAILFVTLGGYLYFSSRKNQKPVNLAQTVNSADIKPPESNRATITLAGGEKIFLDSVAAGALASQGMTQLVKKGDGKIAYELASGTPALTTPALNTLYNPRGSRVITITLSDGSQVWLNAESSLTYPVAFTGNERKVSITGEGYFEIAHNATHPFIVTQGDREIKVLGTHFNVHAYPDESEIKVTLLEGSVKLTQLSNHESRIVRPGEQVSVTEAGGNLAMQVDRNVNLDKVMAWKNGAFDFDHEKIDAIMLQIARWYDVEVQYQGDKPGDLFSGIIKRDNNISQVLKLFEQTGGVQFKIEGEKIIVKK